MTTNGKAKVVWSCNVCCENLNKSNHAPILVLFLNVLLKHVKLV